MQHLRRIQIHVFLRLGGLWNLVLHNETGILISLHSLERFKSRILLKALLLFFHALQIVPKRRLLPLALHTTYIANPIMQNTDALQWSSCN